MDRYVDKVLIKNNSTLGSTFNILIYIFILAGLITSQLSEAVQNCLPSSPPLPEHRIERLRTVEFTVNGKQVTVDPADVPVSLSLAR